jgi:hypothetical protein
MNLILEKTESVAYFTDMARMLWALGLPASTYDWYISDIAANGYAPWFEPVDQWMSGEALQQLLTHGNVQFEWAVFSAVPKGYRYAVVDAPGADGNPDYWTGNDIGPQLPGALFEISCFDSSATIFVGLPPELVERLCRAYPDVKPLAARSS